MRSITGDHKRTPTTVLKWKHKWPMKSHAERPWRLSPLSKGNPDSLRVLISSRSRLNNAIKASRSMPIRGLGIISTLNDSVSALHTHSKGLRRQWITRSAWISECWTRYWAKPRKTGRIQRCRRFNPPPRPQIGLEKRREIAAEGTRDRRVWRGKAMSETGEWRHGRAQATHRCREALAGLS